MDVSDSDQDKCLSLGKVLSTRMQPSVFRISVRRAYMAVGKFLVLWAVKVNGRVGSIRG